MSAPVPKERSALPDWGAPAPPVDRAPVMDLVAWVVALAIAGTLLAVNWSPLLLVAFIVGAVVVAGVQASRAAREGASLLPNDLRPIAPGSRMARLVSGVSRDLGIPEPDVYIFAGDPVNALVAHRRSGHVVCLSSQLIASYGLTELEAVVTHCLVRVRAGVPDPAWRRLIPGWTRRVLPCWAAGLDAMAAAVTRYPPALASAIRKADPRDGRDQGLWFVPQAAGDCAPDPRAEALEDL